MSHGILAFDASLRDHPPFPLAELCRPSGDSRVSGGTDGAARALSGATGSPSEEPCCWHDATRGQMVATHTTPGAQQGHPGFISR
jgi:hypothetical protein